MRSNEEERLKHVIGIPAYKPRLSLGTIIIIEALEANSFVIEISDNLDIYSG